MTLEIRLLQLDDISQGYADGMNNPVVHEFLMGGGYGQLTVKDQTRYVLRSLENPDDFLFGIFVPEHIGIVRLYNINRLHGFADVGICLFRPMFWGKGYASRALSFIKLEAQRRGIRYLEAGVYVRNARSLKLFERAEFRETHRLKDKYKGGEVVYLAYKNILGYSPSCYEYRHCDD